MQQSHQLCTAWCKTSSGGVPEPFHLSCNVSNEDYIQSPPRLQAQECENLMRVVRELTASRAKLVAGKSAMAERFAELQAEYIKVLRIAELSRAASRSNLAKADKATNLAKQVISLLHALMLLLMMCKPALQELMSDTIHQRVAPPCLTQQGRQERCSLLRHHLCTYSP